MIEALLEFGVAGLMGVLWMWERAHSRGRERQLSQAHDQIHRRDEKLSVLVRTVRRNTAAMMQFQQTQEHLAKILEALTHEFIHGKSDR